MASRSRLELKIAVLESLSPYDGKKISHLMRESGVSYNALKPFLDFYIKSGHVSKKRGKLVGIRNGALSNNPKVCPWFYYFLTEKGRQILKRWKVFSIEWMNIWNGSLYE